MIQNTKKARTIVGFAFFFVGLGANILGPILLMYYGERTGNPLLFELNKSYFPGLGLTIIGLGVMVFVGLWLSSPNPLGVPISGSGAPSSLQKELDAVIERVKEEPGKAKPAWDLARVKLELYFDRNLSQINYIFWLSLGVMIVGFLFILFGISQALTPAQNVNAASSATPISQSTSITPAIIGGIAGVVTEFIGATFLFIYRSTIQQAAGYTKTLERINSVGMAMQILDSISEDSKQLQDKTKAEIVKILLSKSEENSAPVIEPKPKAKRPPAAS